MSCKTPDTWTIFFTAFFPHSQTTLSQLFTLVQRSFTVEIKIIAHTSTNEHKSFYTQHKHRTSTMILSRRRERKGKNISRGFLFRKKRLTRCLCVYKAVWSSQISRNRQKKDCLTNFQTHPNSEILFQHAFHNRRRYYNNRENKFTSTKQSQLLVYFSLLKHAHTYLVAVIKRCGGWQQHCKAARLNLTNEQTIGREIKTEGKWKIKSRK